MAESSFGPHGRGKALLGGAGAVVVTRDCGQILQHQQQQRQRQQQGGGAGGGGGKSFVDILLRACEKHGEMHGDGTMSLFLFASSLLDSISGSIAGEDRIHLLIAIQHILYVFHTYQHEFRDILVKAKLMFEVRELSSEIIQGVLMNMLVPATNIRIAENLTKIVLEWYELNHLNRSKTIRYESVLENFDLYIISSSIGSLSDSYVVPHDHILIEGNCKDLKFICSSDSDYPHDRFSFVCIRQFFSEAVNNTQNDNTTLRISGGLTALTSTNAIDISSFIPVAGLNLLTRDGIKVIFSSVLSGDVCPGIIYQMSLHGIVLIDSVPHEHLNHLGSSAGVTIFTDFDAFVKEYNANPERKYVAYLNKIERVSMGFGADKNYLRIGGIEKTINNKSPQSGGVSQIVLRGCGSSVISGMYRRLLKRCFIVIKSFSDDDSSPHYVLPGCGINEMNWCVIWDEVIRVLDEGFDFRINRDCGVISPLYSISWAICLRLLRKYDNASERKDCPLYMSGDAVLTEIGILRVKQKRNVLHSLRYVGKKISEAYLIIPQQLVCSRLPSIKSQTCTLRAVRAIQLWKKHVTSHFLNTANQTHRLEQLHVRIITQVGLLKQSHGNEKSEGISGLPADYVNIIFPSCSFLSGFLSALEIVRLNLRVGGATGILASKSHQEISKTFSPIKRLESCIESDDCGCEDEV